MYESEPNVALERDFMGRHIDDTAAVVHKKLLSEGHERLSDQERYQWSRFLLSLTARTPEMIDFMRRAGQQLMAQAMDEQPDRLMHSGRS